MKRAGIIRSLSRPLIAAALLAILVWLTSSAILLTGDWYLACSNGQGTDCVGDFPGSARVDNAPARWFGFMPLVAVWVFASLALVASLVIAQRQRHDTEVNAPRPSWWR